MIHDGEGFLIPEEHWSEMDAMQLDDGDNSFHSKFHLSDGELYEDEKKLAMFVAQ